MSQLLSTERPTNLLPSPRPVDAFCPAAVAVITTKGHRTDQSPSDCRLIPRLSGLAPEQCSRRSKQTKRPDILQCKTSRNPFRRLRLQCKNFSSLCSIPLSDGDTSFSHNCCRPSLGCHIPVLFRAAISPSFLGLPYPRPF